MRVGFKEARASLVIGALAFAAGAGVAGLVRVPGFSADAKTCGLHRGELGRFVAIPGGGFVKGAQALYPEEGPPQKVFVSPFRLQIHEVTNGQFAAFAAATGYVTEAERNRGSAQFAESDPPNVFMSWWRLDPEATWKTPGGAGSNLEGLALHPVVHVTLNDARA